MILKNSLKKASHILMKLKVMIRKEVKQLDDAVKINIKYMMNMQVRIKMYWKKKDLFELIKQDGVTQSQVDEKMMH